MENMSMYLTWTPDCIFVFQSFHTKELEPFLIGCAVTILFCALAVGHGSLKKALTPYFRVNVLSMRIFKAVNKVIELLLRYFVMFLMMTMNGYVNICIAVGIVLGYIIFRREGGTASAGYKKL